VAKLMMISSDTHAAPTDYAKWLDPQYRDGIDDLIKFTVEIERRTWSSAPDEKTLAMIDTRGCLASGGREGLWDPARRMAELEAEGFVAQVLFPGDMSSVGMYFSNLNMPYPADYRAAGCRAHNRWLAEFCSYAPGRMFGVAQMEPWPDMDACVQEIIQARKMGLGGIALPRFPDIEPNQPSLTSPDWDPFWRACVDNDFPVCVHIGHGHKQGSTYAGILQMATLPVTGHPEPAPIIHWDPGRRPLWQLIFSGVFDRFPELRVTFSEIRTDWVPVTLAHLERRFDLARFNKPDVKLPKLRPTDYWRRNCSVSGQLRPYEMSLRHQIGVEQMMFGHDYPHAESSWPNSREWLRLILKNVPESEARLILGENAARIYGFDVAALAPHVERVGPEPSELIGDFEVSRDLIDNLQWRAVFLSQAYQYEPEPIDALIDEDARSLAMT